MSLAASKVLPLGIESVIDIINQFKSRQSDIQTESKTTNLVPLEKVPLKQKTKQKANVATLEVLRENHNTSRRDSVETGLKLLEIKEIINDLDEIAKARNSDHYYGFKPTKKINTDDAIIGQIAQGLSDVLNIYPSSQNIETASGFIQMVDLIDDLEGVANSNQQGGFGFRSEPEVETAIHKQAAKSASELRAKISYLLEWIEVPKYKIAKPSRN